MTAGGYPRIAFVTDAVTHQHAGVGRYAKEVFSRLEKMHVPLIPVDWRSTESLRDLLSKSIRDSIIVPNRWPFFKTLLWHLFLLRRLKGMRDSFDVLFSPSQFIHLFGKAQTPFVYVVHDVTFMRHPEYHKRGRKLLFRLFFAHTLSKADRIVCISDYTRAELTRYFRVDPEKIVVSHLAAGSEYEPIADAEILRRLREKYELPAKFILFVGTVEPRKNLEAILHAYHLIKNEISAPLIIVGRKGWRANSLANLHERLGLTQRVRFLGFVPEDDLPSLYSAATLFVWLSKDEGFGLPPLEAMQCGTPVVLSSAGSLPEIAGGAALMVDPDDPPAVGDAIVKLIRDPELRTNLRQKGLERASTFSWERTAADLGLLFQNLAGKGNIERR